MKEYMLTGLREQIELITSTIERGHLDWRSVWPTLELVANFHRELLDHPDEAEPGVVLHRYVDVLVRSSEDFTNCFRRTGNG